VLLLHNIVARSVQPSALLYIVIIFLVEYLTIILLCINY